MSDLLGAVQDAFGQAVDNILSLFTRQQKELITILRQPTPIKISTAITADVNGMIGGGIVTQNPVTVWQCPESHEAWINRIAITSPGHPPQAPLQTGQVMCIGSTAGEILFFLPIAGNVAPVIITEGRLSAAHLNPGERIGIVADTLPSNTSLRIDLQLVLVTGISPDTPRTNPQGRAMPGANSKLFD